MGVEMKEEKLRDGVKWFAFSIGKMKIRTVRRWRLDDDICRREHVAIDRVNCYRPERREKNFSSFFSRFSILRESRTRLLKCISTIQVWMIKKKRVIKHDTNLFSIKFEYFQKNVRKIRLRIIWFWSIEMST